MLANHISTIIQRHLGYPPTIGQTSAIAQLGAFLTKQENDEVFLLKGYAGTGKTTVISAMVKACNELKIKTVLLAPTGRAAKVLTKYAGKSASTIHKKIYRQKSSGDGFGGFVLDKNFHAHSIFLVDEASMIASDSGEASIFGKGRLLDDLIEYVYTGEQCKLILCGDTAQLPPVGMSISPALHKEVIAEYLLEVKEDVLKDIVRQESESGILVNATLIRDKIDGNQTGFPKLQLMGYPDVERLPGADLIEALSSVYDKFGMEECIVVCRTNKRANIFNQGIRNQILWKEERIAKGDYIMVVKNNYFWLPENEKTDFIANGDIAEVIDIDGYEDRYGYSFADITIRIIDYDEMEVSVKVILETLTMETPSMGWDENKVFYQAVSEEYQHLTTKKKRFDAIRKDPYFNALQIKFAYAVTCHKAQGGQWKSVFLDQGYVTEDMITIDYLRWLYTAFTRPIEKLYLVNFRKEFFQDEGQG